MSIRHPDLAPEQRVVNHCYDCHEATLDQLRRTVAGAEAGADAKAQYALRQKAIGRLADLEAVDTRRLVVGRMDFEESDRAPMYIGPMTIMDGGKVQVV